MLLCSWSELHILFRHSLWPKVLWYCVFKIFFFCFWWWYDGEEHFDDYYCVWYNHINNYRRTCIPSSLYYHLQYMESCFCSCDQAALWMVQSVHPSVHPSVCPSVTPFWLCSHHRIIMKFPGVITSDRSDVHAKDQGQRSRSQRSQPNLTVSGL